ncbi:MAG: GGDEF domain-containing protein [Coriobacteriia bacterium]|nr:GGDEF domain-containing protein [Coriobacteriia bacterium]
MSEDQSSYAPCDPAVTPHNDITEPPDFDELEHERLRKTHLRALPIALCGAGLAALFALLTSQYSMAWPPALAAVGFVIAYACVRKGLLGAATLIIVITAISLVTVTGLRGNGLHDPATFAYPVIVIWAGMTLETRPFVLTAIFAGLSAVLLAVESMTGWIGGPSSHVPTPSELVAAAIIFPATAYAVWMLATAARESLATARCEIARRHIIEQELRELTIRDELTGLFNRRFFDAELARLEATRAVPVSIIVCDIDGLKTVNDEQGHAAGDQLLIEAATALSTVVRNEDVLARVGGDEFSILLPETDSHDADQAMARIRDHLSERADGGAPAVSLSMGAATSADGELWKVRLAADSRMYAAKAQAKAQGFAEGAFGVGHAGMQGSVAPSPAD